MDKWLKDINRNKPQIVDNSDDLSTNKNKWPELTLPTDTYLNLQCIGD